MEKIITVFLCLFFLGGSVMAYDQSLLNSSDTVESTDFTDRWFDAFGKMVVTEKANFFDDVDNIIIFIFLIFLFFMIIKSLRRHFKW